MYRRVYLLGFWVWILAVQLPSAHAETPFQDQYLQIYVKMHDAENLEKQQDYAGALDGFKDCYARLARIHNEDPTWESALVVHRMADCQVTIQRLQNEVATNPTPPPSPVASPPPIAPSPTPIDMSTMPTDVPGLQKKLQEVETQLKITQDSLRNSQIEVDTYKGQLESVNAQLQAIRNKQSVDDKVGRLLTENKALTEKLNQAEKQIDDLKSPNPKSKVALMQSQLKNLQDQFDESQAANKALQTTITTLQQHLDQAQTDLVNANQRLANAGPSDPEYATIKRENEVMRGILTREIQEQAHRDMAKRLYQEEFDNLKIKSKVLQEQLDILASPMTPATTDEERALLASLKAPGPEITPPPDAGNNLSATANPPATTDATATNAAAAAPMAPDANATNNNAIPPTIASNNPNTPPTPPTDPSTPSTPAVDPNVNATPSTPPTATAPDTTVTTTPAAVTPPPSNPDTTSTTPAANPPATPDNSTPPMATTTTVSQVPGGTTTTVTTTTQDTAAAAQNDPTQYSTKARLPDEMRDTAQEAADLFKMKRYDESAAKYQTIIDKYPESLYAWSNLGVVRYQQGDLDDALKALQQAVKLSPTDSFSYANLGIVYYEMKQYENAIDALNSAKALDPNDAKVRNYLGCACSQKGWQEAAEKEFLEAIKLDPSFGDAHFNLALVYATEKPPLIEMAAREYKKAQELGIAKDDRLEKLLQDNPSATPSQP